MAKQRTAAEFNRGVGRLRYATVFTVSEATKHISQDDPEHLDKCANYSRTLVDRLAGCLEQHIIDQFREDWLAGIPSVESGGHARQKAGWLVGHAIRVFGVSVSLAREAQIIKAMIDNRIPGHYYTVDTDARTAAYQLVIETFDDTTLLIHRGVVVVKIDDDPNRMMRTGDSVKFDAPAVLNCTNFQPTDTTGVILDFDIPIGYQLALEAVYNAYTTPGRNEQNVAPTEVTTPVSADASNNLTLETYYAATNALTPAAGEARREFTGIRARITALPEGE